MRANEAEYKIYIDQINAYGCTYDLTDIATVKNGQLAFKNPIVQSLDIIENIDDRNHYIKYFNTHNYVKYFIDDNIEFLTQLKLNVITYDSLNDIIMKFNAWYEYKVCNGTFYSKRHYE